MKDIGKLGLARERKRDIPMGILDENKQIKTETYEVLRKWKSEYEHLFNDKMGEVFDQEHLKNIVSSIQNPDNNVFRKLDCTSLSSPLTVEEVNDSVYNAKLQKAIGCDNIPADVLRNEHCIDLLIKIIKFAFEVPSQCQKGIINPIAKEGHPRHPLSYRPITLLSIPCKIYEYILNKRLCQW